MRTSDHKARASVPIQQAAAGEAPAIDEHHGKGGSYQMVDGKRVRVAYTMTAEEAAQADAAAQAGQAQPGSAG